MSNQERIKNMNQEELIDFLSEFDTEEIESYYCWKLCKLRKGHCPVQEDDSDCPFKTKDCVKIWLESEALND